MEMMSLIKAKRSLLSLLRITEILLVMLNLGRSTNASGSLKINEIRAKTVPIVAVIAAIDPNQIIATFLTSSLVTSTTSLLL